jgi:hypothetical protein
MASEVEICNRALQKLGADPITSLTENSKRARECNRAYEPLRDALLRKHKWSFAIERAELSALSDAPAFGWDYEYQLPTDCMRLLHDDPGYVPNTPTRSIEGRSILTDETAPLQIRYVKQVTDPNEMDPLFRETLACEIALELCEAITQSNTKKADIRQDRKETLAEAKRVNAIEKEPEESPEDYWVTVRN